MLKNDALVAKIGVDTAENEPFKVHLVLFNFNPTQGFNFHIFTPSRLDFLVLLKHPRSSADGFVLRLHRCRNVLRSFLSFSEESDAVIVFWLNSDQVKKNEKTNKRIQV